ncbi:hypothetical protein KC686_03900, partial [Candidatus Woesebacteria bacterium]|nr:hypothetical protein [Candidatus Woesebacteria bacterium]
YMNIRAGMDVNSQDLGDLTNGQQLTAERTGQFGEWNGEQCEWLRIPVGTSQLDETQRQYIEIDPVTGEGFMYVLEIPGVVVQIGGINSSPPEEAETPENTILLGTYTYVDPNDEGWKVYPSIPTDGAEHTPDNGVQSGQQVALIAVTDQTYKGYSVVEVRIGGETYYGAFLPENMQYEGPSSTTQLLPSRPDE